MRGLYAHASDRMHDELKSALQVRWEYSLRSRAAITPNPRSRCSPRFSGNWATQIQALRTQDDPRPPNAGRQGEDDLPASPDRPMSAIGG
jgi:hypothetical protein